ncbi:MAG: O-antigen ligase family protein [Hyphomicrobium sp.]
MFVLTALVFLVALFVGGGTRAGFAGDVLLQYLSVPLLLLAIVHLVRPENRSQSRGLLWACGLIAVVPILHLLPMPPGLRSFFPGKSWIDETYALLDRPPPYWPLSMAPHATWLALLSLIPPVAVCLGVASLNYRERRTLSLLLLAFSVLSVFVGLMQLAQGANSPLRFYAFTNPTEAVGFFANRNHYSALLYCASLTAAAWLINVVGRAAADTNRKIFETSTVLRIAGVLTMFAVIVIAQTMARSRAGLMLSIVALFVAPALALTDRRNRGTRARSATVLFGAGAFAIVFSLQYALYRILDRFAADPLEDARILIARKTYEAAKSFLPFGSGPGTFVSVYPLFEKPQDVTAFFANRAHNDVLEGVLESGLFAIALMVVFVVWLLRRSYSVWRSAVAEGIAEIDLMLMKTALPALVLLALHSFVDYPLRTSAIMTLAAFYCALLWAPIGADEGRSGTGLAGAHDQHAQPRHAPSTQGHGHAPAHTAPPRASTTWVPPPDAGVAPHHPHAPRPRGQHHSGHHSGQQTGKPTGLRPDERWTGADAWPQEWRDEADGKGGAAAPPHPKPEKSDPSEKS